MSLVAQSTREKGEPPRSGHWAMLLFESFSVGTIVVLLVIVAAMVLVGVYAVLVWPLTNWDLGALAEQKYLSWWKTGLWSLFAGGSLAGFLCVSGLAFRRKSETKAPTARFD